MGEPMRPTPTPSPPALPALSGVDLTLVQLGWLVGWCLVGPARLVCVSMKHTRHHPDPLPTTRFFSQSIAFPYTTLLSLARKMLCGRTAIRPALRVIRGHRSAGQYPGSSFGRGGIKRSVEKGGAATGSETGSYLLLGV
jgi:hypothetical protein